MSTQFPSFDKVENLRFTRYVRLLDIIYSNMISGHGYITKRQIYYTDVALFRKQRIVDEYIDTIAECLGVNIHRLNVVAAQKGLIFGNIELTYKGTSISINEDQGPSLIPQILLSSEHADFEFQNTGISPKEIMVIEKEAIFKSLCVTLRGKGIILVTGKGFPDRSTRIFLHYLSEHFHTTPVRAYVDSDVYGIMIFNQFKYTPTICKKRKMVRREKICQKETAEIIVREEYESSCRRLLYGGIKLFGNQMGRIKGRDQDVLAFHYLQISERNMASMQRLLGRMIDKRENDEQPGETHLNGTACENNKDFEITKVIREVQLGMFFMLKREMQEAE